MALSYHTDYRHNDVILNVLQGRERIVSYPTTSPIQFNDRIGSYASLAAINFASVLFELTDHHKGGLIDVLRTITSNDTIEVSVNSLAECGNETVL